MKNLNLTPEQVLARLSKIKEEINSFINLGILSEAAEAELDEIYMSILPCRVQIKNDILEAEKE